MSVLAPLPPRPPAAPPDAGVIADARRRRRRRRGRALVGALALIAAAAAGYAALVASDAPAGGRDPHAAGRPGRCPGRALGMVAFIGGADSDSLETVDLRDCRTRVLVGHGARGGTPVFSVDGREIAFEGGWVATAGGPVHRTGASKPGFSPDGRFVAYGDRVAPVSGGVARALGGTFAAWLPHRDALLLVNGSGAIERRTAGGATRALTPPGWRASLAAIAPDGRSIVVERYRSLSGTHPPGGGELWLIDLASGRRRLLYAEPGHLISPFLATAFSPGGRWALFSEDPGGSADIPADGVPQYAVALSGGAPRAISTIRGGGDAWCGGSLVYVIDHGGRVVTDGDGIAVTAPPAWRSRTILPASGATSFSEFACRPGREQLALAGGPSSGGSPFGRERRSLWLAPARPGAAPTPIAASVPPRGQTDELPMWSADGRWLLFVRTRPSGISGAGALYAIDLDGGRLVGPIAAVGFTGNFYGSYGWPGQLAWYRP